MRKSLNLQMLAAAPQVPVGVWPGLWQYVVPPLATLLACFLLLAAAFAAPWQTVQDVGVAAPLVSGLYEDEYNQQRTYAYTHADAVVSLPQLGRGAFAVSLTAGAPAEHHTRRVALRVGQHSYPLGTLQPVRTYHLLLENVTGTAAVSIQSEATPVGADPRALGILLDKLSVLTLQPMGVPYPVAGTVLAVTVLLWVLGVSFVRSNSRRLALVLGGSLATCCLYILARGSWEIPVGWLYRGLGLLGLGLLLARLDAQPRSSVRWYRQLAFVFAGAVLLLSRRPDALFNAQFWAEDGALWYRSAYTAGPLQALLTPHTGYFQTLPRLVAAFSLLFPLVWAPLIFNLVALGIQLLPLVLLLSSRYAHAMPVFGARLLLALAYIAVPNPEVHMNLTNAQWHLALTAAMIVFAQPSTRWRWRCFDVAVIALAAVSGPFCMVLAPLCLLRSWARKSRWLLYLGLVLSAGALIQFIALWLPHGTGLRDRAPLGASLDLFSRVVGGQIFVQSVLGPEAYAWLAAQTLWKGWLPLAIAAGGFGLLAYALWKGPLELRLFALFATWIMLGALVSPVNGTTLPQWEVLAQPGVGWRYWRIPVLAFMLVLGYLAYRAPARVVRWTAACLLVVAAAGNLYGWSYRPWADVHWRDHALAFSAAAPGTKVSIPIHPDGWNLSLVKH